MGLPFYETSARDGTNVDQVFIDTGLRVLESQSQNKFKKIEDNAALKNPVKRK